MAEDIQSGRFVCHSVCLSVCLSVCVQPHVLICIFLLQSQGNFIFKVMRVNLQRYVEVPIAQQGLFGIKSTVTQKR